jgi:hypothetical protein
VAAVVDGPRRKEGMFNEIEKKGSDGDDEQLLL